MLFCTLISAHMSISPFFYHDVEKPTCIRINLENKMKIVIFSIIRAIINSKKMQFMLRVMWHCQFHKRKNRKKQLRTDDNGWLSLKFTRENGQVILSLNGIRSNELRNAEGSALLTWLDAPFEAIFRDDNVLFILEKSTLSCAFDPEPAPHSVKSVPHPRVFQQ